MAELVELTRTDGARVCTARVATSFASRFLGLMGTARLPAGRGLLFPRSRSVHTHFMRYPIDVVFLDAERHVVAISRALPPWRFAADRRADAVLELAAGECDRLDLTAGDVLETRPAG